GEAVELLPNLWSDLWGRRGLPLRRLIRRLAGGLLAWLRLLGPGRWCCTGRGLGRRLLLRGQQRVADRPSAVVRCPGRLRRAGLARLRRRRRLLGWLRRRRRLLGGRRLGGLRRDGSGLEYGPEAQQGRAQQGRIELTLGNVDHDVAVTLHRNLRLGDAG